MVNYSGFIMNEGYEHLDIKKTAKPITDPHVCDALSQFSEHSALSKQTRS